jgi:hypothetical protein
MSAIFCIYYCQHGKLSNVVFRIYKNCLDAIPQNHQMYKYVLFIDELRLSIAVVFCTGKCLPLIENNSNKLNIE